MKMTQAAKAPAALSKAIGPLLAATTTFWVAAIATTTGMYIIAQKVTPRSTSAAKKPAFAQEMLRGNQQQHRDANAADVGLDADQRSERLSDEDAHQVADGQQRGSEDHHAAPSPPSVSNVVRSIVTSRLQGPV